MHVAHLEISIIHNALFGGQNMAEYNVLNTLCLHSTSVESNKTNVFLYI